MKKRVCILAAALLILLPLDGAGQEVLSASKVHARANRRFLPALGLPVKSDGQIDRVVRYRDGHWEGADSVRAVPRWTMWAVHAEALPAVAVQLPAQQAAASLTQGRNGSAGQGQQGATPQAGAGRLVALQQVDGAASGRQVVQQTTGTTLQLAAALQGVPGQLTPVFDFCRGWAGESPKGAADVVCGPLKRAGQSAGQAQAFVQSAGQAHGASGGWFAAVCKKTRSGLGWKSIAFIVPPEGIDSKRSIYDYTRSVNYLERRIGYNLFPRLPSNLQEIIEEMTATELVCPYSEFDPGLDEGPDREVEYDMELDYLERD